MKKTKGLKQVIKDEYIKCAQDPVYFMRKYCQIQHPTRGRIPFNLYQFQERSLEQFKPSFFSARMRAIVTSALKIDIFLEVGRLFCRTR